MVILVFFIVDILTSDSMKNTGGHTKIIINTISFRRVRALLARWSRAVFNGISNTCSFPAMTHQTSTVKRLEMVPFDICKAVTFDFLGAVYG